jgi:hypothetical protein
MHSKAVLTLFTVPSLPVVLLLLIGCLIYLYRYGSDPRLDRFLAALALTIPCHGIAMAFAKGANLVRPNKLDLFVFKIDGMLGFQPSFVLARFIHGHMALRVMLALVYDLLPVAIVLLFGGYLWFRSDREAMGMVPVFVWNLALSVVVYLLFPVCGPAYAFPGFPAAPVGPIFAHPMVINAPPNGVPSVHFSTALLIFWYARMLPGGRWIGGVYLFLTAMITMGSGEHYLLDLAIAVPYAVLVYFLGNRKLPRMSAAPAKTCPARMQ